MTSFPAATNAPCSVRERREQDERREGGRRDRQGDCGAGIVAGAGDANADHDRERREHEVAAHEPCRRAAQRDLIPGWLTALTSEIAIAARKRANAGSRASLMVLWRRWPIATAYDR